MTTTCEVPTTCEVVYNNGTTETLDADAVEKLREFRETISGCYFLHNPQNGLIKIGRSRDIWTRWRGLETQAGARLTPLMFWTAEDPVPLERKLHRHFAEHRVIGEWFAAEPVVEWIASPPAPGYVCIPSKPKPRQKTTRARRQVEVQELIARHIQRKAAVRIPDEFMCRTGGDF